MNSYEFAINMELDGEKYYKEQAEINKDNGLKAVFLLLAKDEENHAKVLQNKFDKLSYELKDNNTLAKAKDVFKGIKDFKNEIGKVTKQSDLYKDALEKERQSIDLYKKLLAAATDNQEKKLFEYLVEEETNHFTLLEDLVVLIKRADEWVESAEFGIRKEY